MPSIESVVVTNEGSALVSASIPEHGQWRLGPSSGERQRLRGGTAKESARLQLRHAIVTGALTPGQVVTSVSVAEQFGVSRTPAREALHALQEEGFLVGESNHRLRVVSPSAEELEAVFAERIFLTVVCTRITVPLLSESEIDQMQEQLDVMLRARKTRDHPAWREADIAFHSLHLGHASLTLRSDLSKLFERASMFRAIWLQNRDDGLTFTTDDHPLILQACRARDPQAAGLAAARHLMRIALTLMLEIAPGREPKAVRQALAMAGEGSADISYSIAKTSRETAQNHSADRPGRT